MVSFVVIIVNGLLKPTLLQPFVVNDQSARFPAKYLYRVACSIHKNKHLTAQGVALHLRANHPAKCIKAFAHIGGFPEIIVTQRIV